MYVHMYTICESDIPIRPTSTRTNWEWENVATHFQFNSFSFVIKSAEERKEMRRESCRQLQEIIDLKKAFAADSSKLPLPRELRHLLKTLSDEKRFDAYTDSPIRLVEYKLQSAIRRRRRRREERAARSDGTWTPDENDDVMDARLSPRWFPFEL